MKRIFSCLFILLITHAAFAQAPQKMSYQAVIRNGDNSLVGLKMVGMRISIIQGATAGSIVYAETQRAITNLNGLVSLQIGAGTVITGIFNHIDWSAGPYFIQTETDPDGGNNYTIAGTSELLSVPYALFAMNTNAGNYSGISHDIIDLKTLRVDENFVFQATPGLAYTSSQNIVVSNSIDNHFHATIVTYNRATGVIKGQILEVTGIQKLDYWTVTMDGAKGTQGIQGLTGLAGTNGINGLTGTNGIDGAVGLTGSKGTNGANGLTGATGIDGAIGLTGVIGTNGTNGVNGTNGINGAMGPMGLPGLTGATGSFNGVFLGDVTGNQQATVVDKINGTSLSLLATGILKNTTATGIPSIAIASDFPNLNQNTTGTAANITGMILPQHGGTGIANDNQATLSLPGVNATTLVTTAPTIVTLPATGTLYGTASASISSAQLLQSISNPTGTGNVVFSASPNFTDLPLAPTAPVGTNSNQLATTAFVLANANSAQSITDGIEITTESPSNIVVTGMSVSPLAGKYLVFFNSQYSITPANKTGYAKTDIKAAYTLLMAKTVTNSSHPAGYGSGETIVTGVYTTVGNCTAAGNIILDAQNNPNAEFIFRFSGSFVIAGGTTVSLINGALACNVYWVAETTTTMGASSNLKGAFISNTGSISMSSNCVLEGRMFANIGAISLIASTVAMPIGGNSIFGSAAGFEIFSGMGNVLNMGISNITGDIGTNSGTISGLGSSIVNGNVYIPSVVPAYTTAIFGIYQNGVLLAFSERSRISSLILSEVTLQGMVTISSGATIDIRMKIDAGTIKLQNRILTLLQVK